ncbi:MAG: iron ABC transporter permease [Acidimicrobiales bacterium]|nr:iron ABC transporter permease [Acidimicrobiales bacterium]
MARRPPAPLGLRLTSVVIGAAFALPGGYVLWRAITLGSDAGEVADEVVEPLWRTVQLGTLVAIGAALLGTSLAWLLVRTDVPLRRLWAVLMPLPLVFPSFVGAAAFIAGLAPDGLLRDLLEMVGYDAPRRFRGMGAAWLVLTLFTYPYVFLPVAARLSMLHPSLEESARMLGDSPLRAFRRVVLPQIRGAILAGTLLVFLYTLSDFGAVQLLGFDTLTRVIFATRLADRAVSFGAALVLLMLAVVVVVVERRIRGAHTVDTRVSDRPPRTTPLGAWRIPALIGILGVVMLALVVPIASLSQWAWRGLERGDRVGSLSDQLGELTGPAWTSAWLSVVAAVAAVAAVLPVAMMVTRYRSRLSAPVNAAVVGGFAVPGLVIALSLVFWSLNAPGFEFVYETVPLLIMAYVVHFGSQAMRAAEVAVSAVPDRLRESSRLLGASPLRRLTTIDLPLMRPGLLAGGGLVLLSTVKELPATLLLAPTDVETLTIRVWKTFDEGYYAEAGLASLALVLVSGLLTWGLVLRRSDHLA